MVSKQDLEARSGGGGEERSAGPGTVSRRGAVTGLLGLVACSGYEGSGAERNERGASGQAGSSGAVRENLLLQQSRGVANVLTFGAKGDCIEVDILPDMEGDRIVRSPNAVFKNGDVGKSIAFVGAAENGGAITATIEKFISPESVRLDRAVVPSRKLTKAVFGTDDSKAIQAALTAEAVVLVPKGYYFHRKLILKHQAQIIAGDSTSTSILFCPDGSGLLNYEGDDSKAVDGSWVGDFIIRTITLSGGFVHEDRFDPPYNSWSEHTGRDKKLTLAGLNTGLRLKRCHPYSLRDVEIRNFHRGVFLSGGALGRWSNFRIADCEVGFWGENGAAWGDIDWKVTTHSWREGIFARCWIGIGGADLVQCEVLGKTVDFEPCNTGIAIKNGGDNIWSGYFELCSEGIYRTGSFMGMDVVADPFFAGKKGTFWGSGDSILLDRDVGPGGGITLRDDGRDIGGGGIRILRGRLKRPGYYFGTKVLLAMAAPVSTPESLSWNSGDGLDTMSAFDSARSQALSIAPMFAGATVRLRLSCMTSMTMGEPGRAWIEFRRNGAPFPGTIRQPVPNGRMQTTTMESGPIVVAAGDVFTVHLETEIPVVCHSGNASWFGMDLLA